MIRPKPTLAAVGMLTAGAALLRRRWARRQTRSTSGAAPGCRTDDGVTLHIEVVETGPQAIADPEITVVFAHGFAARLDEFDHQCRHLGGRVRLVLFDQRGHGASGWGDHRHATVPQLGRDLATVVRQTTGSEPVTLVGHSLGAMAVLSFAAQWPDLIGSKIVGAALIATAAGRLARRRSSGRLRRFVVRSRLLATWLRMMWWLAPLLDLVRPLDTRLGRRWLLRRLFSTGQVPADLARQTEDMLFDMSHATASAFYPSVLYHEEDAGLAALRRIPTAVVTGTDDATIPSWHSERIAQELGGNARLTCVGGAGHMVNLTHPEVVNRALDDLLDRALPRPGGGRNGQAS
jgi:pimeloyl-ACP methyl ester carboxylesterase